MKKIDFTQPKYALGFVTLPFVLLLTYLFSTQLKGTTKEEDSDLKMSVTESFNEDLPEPYLTDRETKKKFDAYVDVYKNQKDYSAIIGVEKEGIEELSDTESSIYSQEEIDQIESLHERNYKEAQKVKELQRKFFEEKENKTNSEQESEETKRLRLQMALIDSLKSIGNEKNESRANNEAYIKQQTEGEKTISEAVKASNPTGRYFNTISRNKTEKFITAILDQSELVKDGSRIRIRILDDIVLGDVYLNKGAYLYGIIGGFSKERVIININSVLYNDQIISTKLTVYDNDGIKGLYVPNSDFREIMQSAGTGLGQQQIDFSNGETNMEQFAYGALQDIYRTTAQVLTKKIKQNKATLKYSTVVYLINEREK